MIVNTSKKIKQELNDILELHTYCLTVANGLFNGDYQLCDQDHINRLYGLSLYELADKLAVILAKQYIKIGLTQSDCTKKYSIEITYTQYFTISMCANNIKIAGHIVTVLNNIILTMPTEVTDILQTQSKSIAYGGNITNSTNKIEQTAIS